MYPARICEPTAAAAPATAAATGAGVGGEEGTNGAKEGD
jgi:hypothetical protein